MIRISSILWSRSTIIICKKSHIFIARDSGESAFRIYKIDYGEKRFHREPRKTNLVSERFCQRLFSSFNQAGSPTCGSWKKDGALLYSKKCNELTQSSAMCGPWLDGTSLNKLVVKRFGGQLGVLNMKNLNMDIRKLLLIFIRYNKGVVVI